MFITHLNKEYINCHLCTNYANNNTNNNKNHNITNNNVNNDYRYLKFTYYKNYNSLKIHYRLSHFMCENSSCID